MKLPPSAVGASPLLASPGPRLLLITLIGLIACLVVTVFALRGPWLGLTLAPSQEGRGLQVIQSIGPASAVPAGSRLLGLQAGATADPNRLTAGTTSLDVQNLDLTEDIGLLPSFVEVRRFMMRQTQLHDLLGQSSVTLQWESPEAGGERRHTTVTPAAERPLSSLPWLYWVQLLSGLLALLIGCWVWVLQPHDWGARLFAITGAAMLSFTLPAAWYSTRELALDGTLLDLLSGINMSGAILFGCALISIFLCFPRQLVPLRALLAIPVIFGALLVADLLQLWPRPLGNLITLLQTLVALACAAWQWRATRNDPAARAALRWVALSALVGAALFVVPMGIAPLLGGAPPLPQGLGFVFFLIMYAGIALGVARFRLFALDEWAYRILLWVSGVLLLLVVDAALIWLLHLAPALSLGVSLLIVGFLYLPLRNWFWRRLVTRHGLSEDALFRGVLDVVLEPDDRRRTAQWRNLLQRLFQPLEIRDLDEPLASPVLRDDGLTLDFPAVAGAPALRLRYPWQGRGLFSRDYLRLARRLMVFLAQADASRAEFARGVAEERQRITRDLHDDIASRLISSLHQAQDPAIKRTLRSTLQDLRTILSGLAGESMSLDGLLERLHEEAGERLDAANIALEWQVPEALPDWAMEYPVYKNLLSVQREILSNVLRHSHAALVRIAIALEGDGVRFTTTDFRTANALAAGEDAGCDISHPGMGMGMANMQQRLAQIHGTIEHHEHEEGHAVTLWVPLRSPQMAPPLLS
ncbi:MAG: hypothetical protein M0R28_01480 [Pigmentiphaga sp.]|nr:hypothetical protein [Pigmentiphaga sp.]